MNQDFPRIIKLLRKERGLHQNEAAEQLGVNQSLLSHYERGKRECGLDFLTAAADFYGVSVDYLLGRTSSRTGMIVSEEQLPESTVSEGYEGDPAGAPTMLKKKVITNSLEVIFSLLVKSKNHKLANAVSSFLLTAVYRAYRMLYSAGNNDENSFSVPHETVAGACFAKLSIDDAKAAAAVKGGSKDEKINNARIEREFPRQSSALFMTVTNVEHDLHKLIK